MMFLSLRLIRVESFALPTPSVVKIRGGEVEKALVNSKAPYK